MDDLADNIVMSDFTMDYFLAQLRQYLEKNKEELDATPNGAYAVAPNPQGGPGAGALFLLKQLNASTASRRRLASPVHPFYLVYIRDDGRIRYGCANTRQALEAFETAATGHPEPITMLCDWFDRETKQGTDMKRYNGLLKQRHRPHPPVASTPPLPFQPGPAAVSRDAVLAKGLRDTPQRQRLRAHYVADNQVDLRNKIRAALAAISGADFANEAQALLHVLDYRSERTLARTSRAQLTSSSRRTWSRSKGATRNRNGNSWTTPRPCASSFR